MFLLAKSVLQAEKVCWVTGAVSGLHEHHIFGGARRKLSEKYGLKVYLRFDLHERAHREREFADELHRAGQRAFERTHSREEFMRIFGKNYLFETENVREKVEEKSGSFDWEFSVIEDGEVLPYGL